MVCVFLRIFLFVSFFLSTRAVAEFSPDLRAALLNNAEEYYWGIVTHELNMDKFEGPSVGVEDEGENGRKEVILGFAEIDPETGEKWLYYRFKGRVSGVKKMWINERVVTPDYENWFTFTTKLSLGENECSFRLEGKNRSQSLYTLRIKLLNYRREGEDVVTATEYRLPFERTFQGVIVGVAPEVAMMMVNVGGTLNSTLQYPAAAGFRARLEGWIRTYWPVFDNVGLEVVTAQMLLAKLMDTSRVWNPITYQGTSKLHYGGAKFAFTFTDRFYAPGVMVSVGAFKLFYSEDHYSKLRKLFYADVRRQGLYAAGAISWPNFKRIRLLSGFNYFRSFSVNKLMYEVFTSFRIELTEMISMLINGRMSRFDTSGTDSVINSVSMYSVNAEFMLRF